MPLNRLVGVRRLAATFRIFKEKSKNRFRWALLKTGGMLKVSCSTVFRIFILGMAYLLALMVSGMQFFCKFISKPQKSLLRKSKQGEIDKKANPGIFLGEDI